MSERRRVSRLVAERQVRSRARAKRRANIKEPKKMNCGKQRNGSDTGFELTILLGAGLGMMNPRDAPLHRSNLRMCFMILFEIT